MSLSNSPLAFAHTRRHSCLFMFGCALLSSGCSTSETKSTDAGREPDASVARDGGSTNGSDAKVGDFAIRLVPPTPASSGSGATEGFTSITGKVYDGPIPAEIAWQTALEAAGCVLLKPQVPFCDPPCAGNVCVADGSCLSNPNALDVGAVSIKGLTTGNGKAELTLKQVASVYSAPADVALPYPAFAEGEPIELSAQGGASGPFSLSAHGIPPLLLASEVFALDPKQPLGITWNPPEKAGISRIRIKLDISHHGGTKGKIECDVEDSGALEIPANMIASLTALGIAGFPTIVVTRASTGSAKIPAGRVHLTIYSDVERSVEIAGLKSCTDDVECTDGTRCQSDLTCK